MDRAHRILCIDDDPFYGDLYRQMLEPKGYEVNVATNTAVGYASLEKSAPSLVILDVMMPESAGFRDGFALLETLRKEERTKKLPVIMISALGNEDDVRHGMDLGATAFIPKQDLTPKRLLAELKEHGIA